MAPLPLAVVFKTLGSRAINLPLNALRRKLVKENWFDFQNKVLKESFNEDLTSSLTIHMLIKFLVVFVFIWWQNWMIKRFTKIMFSKKLKQDWNWYGTRTKRISHLMKVFVSLLTRIVIKDGIKEIIRHWFSNLILPWHGPSIPEKPSVTKVVSLNIMLIF